MHVLEGHTRPVLSLAATDVHLFSGSYDHSIRAWDSGSMRLVKSMQGVPSSNTPPLSALIQYHSTVLLTAIFTRILIK